MSWLVAFVGFAVLIVLHELGHFAVAKAVGMRVERFSLFFPPHVWRRTRGETEYALGTIPLGGYVKISGMNPHEELPEEVRTRAYFAQPPWKRIAVILAGPAVNFVLALVLLLVAFGAIGPLVATRAVSEVPAGFPAAGVVEAGDSIVAVDGRRGSAGELSEAIARHRCPQRPPRAGCRASEPVRLTVERDGRLRTFELTPVYDPVNRRMRLGFSYATERDPLALGEAVEVSLDRFWFITRETLKLPLRLFDAEKREEIGSAVGGYEATRQAFDVDVGRAVLVLAIISLSLAIVNLFPFLPLDGGHVFWAIVEKVRRRPVPFAVMERASVVGFMLVIGLFLIGLSNDIDRLQNEGFDVR